MKPLFKKIKENLQVFFYNLIYGMKNTEDVIFHQTGISGDNGTSIVKEVENQRVSKDLLKGEVTQQVEELRYRTYKVDKESKGFEYYAPTLALRKSGQDYKFMKYDDSDGLEIITIQPNDITSKEDSVQYIDKVGSHVVGKIKTEDFYNLNKQINVDIKDTLGVLTQNNLSKEYRIKIKRDFTPRFKIEEYITRLDVKKLDDEHVILDMLVSKYHQNDLKSISFIKEIENIRNGAVKSDTLDYKEISFITHHAYKLDDMIKFVFKNIHFREIVEFDGHYILRFKASLSKENLDLTKRYYSKAMDDKYKAKLKKDVVVNFADYAVAKVYTCEECGKEVLLDAEMIDSLDAYQGRDITSEEIETDNPQVLEFMDMQISEQTFGKRLCSDCLKKYVENNNFKLM